MPSAPTCPTCGRALDEMDRHLRFTLPDPVLETADWRSRPGTWMSHDDPDGSVLMQVPGVGAFVRALLPVSLSDGFTVTFGLWVGVHPEDLQRAHGVWWSDDYADLVLDGRLANDLPLWGLVGAPVRLTVVDPQHTPYCTETTDDQLREVLTREWPHEVVLDALGDH